MCARAIVDLSGFADVPILAEAAGQVAAGSTEGEDRRSREEVIEGFLLDGIHTVAAGATERREHDLIILARPDEAETSLSLPEPTMARAHIALDLPVVEDLPVAGRDDRCVGFAETHVGGTSLRPRESRRFQLHDRPSPSQSRTP